MKKRIKVIIILIVIVLLSIGGIIAYNKYQAYLEEERIKNAIIKIDFIDPLEVEFNKDIKLRDLIIDINGELIDYFKIDTSVVGEKVVSFRYINEEDIKVPYKFNLKVVDKTPPIIWLNDRYYVNVGT